MIDNLLSILAPHSCCGCAKLGSILCDNCINDIVSERFEQCLACLAPTAYDKLCKTCQLTSVIDQAWCTGVREGSLKVLLDRYKFDSVKQVGPVAVTLLDQTVPILPSDVHVVPIPTASSHARTRGFDHIHMIAKLLAQRRHLPYRRLLVRDGSSTQHFKNRKQRFQSAAEGLSIHE